MALDSVVFVPLKPAVVGHVVANSIIEFLVILVVSARFASRIYLGSGLGTDDWLILVATVRQLIPSLGRRRLTSYSDLVYRAADSGWFMYTLLTIPLLSHLR